MKRMTLILNSLIFLTMLLLAACGSDNSTTGTTSGQSALNGGSCSCTASYMPVCGANDITYENICIANCYKVTQTSQGNCICTERPVCGDNGRTYTECEAQAAIRNGYIKKITKFVDCNSASY